MTAASPATSAAITSIGQIAINVHDTDRATAFYRDKLGLKHLFSAGKLSFFDCGGVRLMLSPPEKPEFDHPASILYYKVDDINATHQRLVGSGITFESDPHMVAKLPDHELWIGFLRDSENNLLGIMSEVR